VHNLRLSVHNLRAKQPFDIHHLAVQFSSTAEDFSMRYAFYDETKPRVLVTVSNSGNELLTA
jgi:hypothetical protein